MGNNIKDHTYILAKYNVMLIRYIIQIGLWIVPDTVLLILTNKDEYWKRNKMLRQMIKYKIICRNNLFRFYGNPNKTL